MQKNTAGKWIVFAFEDEGGTNPGEPVTGDAANITANVRIDGGAANAVDDVNPTELEDGYYIFDITAAECNGDLILICPQSATANVNVIGVPGAVYTTPANFNDLGITGTALDTVTTATSVTNDVGVNEWNGVALATTNPLPNAAPDAAGGLPISDAGALDLDVMNTNISAILTDTGTTLDTKIDTIDTVVDAIKVVTDAQAATGTGLTAIPWNAAWDAEVQSEVNDALVAVGLDHLVSAAVTGTDVTDNSIIAKMVSKSATADWDSFVNTTDALEAIADAGGGDATAANQTTIINHLVDVKGTGFVADTHSMTNIEGYADLIDDGTSGLAKIATDVAAILVDTNSLNDTKVPDTISLANINAQCDTALSDIGLDHLISSALPTNWATDVAAGSVFDNIADDGTAAYDRTTDSLQAIADSGGGGPTAAQIADAVWDEAQADHTTGTSFGAIATEIADILVDTAVIGAAGAGLTEAGGTGDHLTAVPWNSAWDAQVESEVSDGLTAFWTSPATLVDLVWDEPLAGHTTAGTSGKALSDAGAAGDPWSTSLPGAYGAGTAGYILGTNLDVASSTLATAAALTTTDGKVDTIDANVDLVLADTAELQGDWTNGGRLDTILDSILDDTGTSGVVVASINTGAITADAIAASALDGKGDWITVSASGTADSGTTTTMVDAARTEAGVDFWKGSWIRFTSGTNTGQTRMITAFTPATDTITFEPSVSTGVTTETYEILPAGAVGIDWNCVLNPSAIVSLTQTTVFESGVTTDGIESVADQVWTEAQADHTSAGSFGEIATEIASILADTGTDGVVVASLAAGSVTAAAIATDAIDADALAADAVAEINATVDTALADIHLDHLLAVDYDPASKPGVATALFNELIESDAGVSRFTANALEQGPSGSGTVDANIIQIEGHALAGTGTQIADGFEYFFNVATPAKTMNDVGTANSGAGAIEHVVTINEGGNPSDGAEVWVTTDEPGSNVVAGTLSTDALGQVTFMLDAGTYYAWAQKSGVNFTNPTEFTVS